MPTRPEASTTRPSWLSTSRNDTQSRSWTHRRCRAAGQSRRRAPGRRRALTGASRTAGDSRGLRLPAEGRLWRLERGADRALPALGAGLGFRASSRALQRRLRPGGGQPRRHPRRAWRRRALAAQRRRGMLVRPGRSISWMPMGEVTELNFRYSHRNFIDKERDSIALTMIEGRHLTYRRPRIWF